MRVVVDTNVCISAALKESSWPGAVVRWLERFDGLLKTRATEREVFEVLQRPRIAEDICGYIPSGFSGYSREPSWWRLPRL